MSDINRINEIIARFSQIGTEAAQDETVDQAAFAKAMLDGNRKMLAGVLAMVESEVTYVKWRKWFIQSNAEATIRPFVDTVEYDRLCAELANLDMREYFELYTKPVFEGGKDCQVVVMLTNLVELLETLQDQ